MTDPRGGLVWLLRNIQALHLYGAFAVAAMGVSLGVLLGFPSGTLAPLWFFGSLGAYNLDRLKYDPADPINVPLRWIDPADRSLWCLLLWSRSP